MLKKSKKRLAYFLNVVMTTRHRERENLAEYAWRSKTAKDVLKYLNALILTKYVKGMPEYIDKDM